MDDMKNLYFATLQKYIDEPLYITDKATELNKEMDRNYWWIGGSIEQIASLSFQEWREYLGNLIQNRQTQLNESKINTDLVFYCYHDHQAGQLRFNVISSAHPNLPFGCKIEEAELDSVIKSFIQDEYGGVIPSESLVPISMEEAEMNEKEPIEFIARVHVHKLSK